MSTTGGYGTVLRHPVAGRLAASTLVSSLGDFVGLGVLLLVMYDRAGRRAIGPALLFAVQAGPALLLATLGSPLLDRVDPRRALVGSALTGAAAIGLVLATSTVFPVLLAAALLGAARSVTVPMRNAVTVGDVPDDLRTSVISLGQAAFQTAQVGGFLLGGTAAVAGLGAAALWFDLATFVVAAVLFATLPVPRRVVLDRPDRRRVGEGFRVIARHPVARSVVPGAWAVLVVGALPEALTPALVDGYWVGPSLVAAAAVTLLCSLWLGRTRFLEDPRRIQLFAVSAPLALLLTGGLAQLGAPPWAIVAAHGLMGLGAMYAVGAQAVLARTVPRDDIVHLAATMGASLIVLEGLGAVVVAVLFDVLSPMVAYTATAAIVTVPIVVGARARPTDEVIELAAESASVA